MRDDVRMVYTDPFLSELRTLSREQRDRVLGRINNAERIGWTAGVKTSKLVPLRDGIWELRIAGARGCVSRTVRTCPGRDGPAARADDVQQEVGSQEAPGDGCGNPAGTRALGSLARTTGVIDGSIRPDE